VIQRPPSGDPNQNDKEWVRAWSVMPHRRLALPPAVEIDLHGLDRLDGPVSFTISLDPVQVCDKVWRGSECCPICGKLTSRDERLAATLKLWRTRGCIGVGVWVHRTCFESCPDTDEPAPVPW
jgi:hypothetical protein